MTTDSPTLTPFTVQCGCFHHYATTVTVDAASAEDACRKAIEEANESPLWKATGDVGRTFVDAIAANPDDAWDADTALTVPARFAANDNG